MKKHDENKIEEDEWKDSDFLMFDDVVNDKNNCRERQSGESGKDNSCNSPSKKRRRCEHKSNSFTTRATSLTVASELPPWMERSHTFKFHRNVPKLVLLHDEIVQFAELMAPRSEELKVRDKLVERITKLIKDTFGEEKCEVSVFGSQATGLLLPSSDVDLVIQLPYHKDNQEKDNGAKEAVVKLGKKTSDLTKDNPASSRKLSEKEREQKEMDEYKIGNHVNTDPLLQLGHAFQSKWIDELSYLDIVENTRVPIIKFTHKSTQISVDICINQELGIKATDLMKRFLGAMPPLKPLIFVLKYFLAARGLNEPYTGGCGSFMIQMMIVSFLQHRERHSYNYRIPVTMNLGALLCEFFELYGIDFNYFTTGISVRSDGFYFPKGSKERKDFFYQPSRPFTLAMENPFDITSDVGKPSFRMQLIQKSFESAFRVLLSHVAEPVVDTESILASILPPSEEMRKRTSKSNQHPSSYNSHKKHNDSDSSDISA